MCNLGKGIREEANAETRAEIIMNMYRNDFSLDQIALATRKTIDEVKAIIEKMKMALA